ncbi:MAG: hypothetical protein QF704_00505 [Anaerolineales bacterium]|nr:hypothetical protein [Anaerolineales bacterium]
MAISTYSKRKQHRSSSFRFANQTRQARERTDTTGEKQRQVQAGREQQPPFYIKGKYATDLEWRVWLALLEIGYDEHDIVFQTLFFGGQSLPGSMVLDFIVSSPPENIPISVEGSYWHQGEKNTHDEFNEARLFVEHGGWLAPLVTFTESEIQTFDMAVSAVKDKVGI